MQGVTFHYFSLLSDSLYATADSEPHLHNDRYYGILCGYMLAIETYQTIGGTFWTWNYV